MVKSGSKFCAKPLYSEKILVSQNRKDITQRGFKPAVKSSTIRTIPSVPESHRFNRGMTLCPLLADLWSQRTSITAGGDSRPAPKTFFELLCES